MRTGERRHFYPNQTGFAKVFPIFGLVIWLHYHRRPSLSPQQAWVVFPTNTFLNLLSHVNKKPSWHYSHPMAVKAKMNGSVWLVDNMFWLYSHPITSQRRRDAKRVKYGSWTPIKDSEEDEMRIQVSWSCLSIFLARELLLSQPNRHTDRV